MTAQADGKDWAVGGVVIGIEIGADRNWCDVLLGIQVWRMLFKFDCDWCKPLTSQLNLSWNFWAKFACLLKTHIKFLCPVGAYTRATEQWSIVVQIWLWINDSTMKYGTGYNEQERTIKIINNTPNLRQRKTSQLVCFVDILALMKWLNSQVLLPPRRFLTFYFSYLSSLYFLSSIQ